MGNADQDGDSYGILGGDCNDTDPAVNPGATEITYNGTDDDCNVITLDGDLDGDTYPIASDCNDVNPSVNPGAADAICNGIDDNCNGWPDDDYVRNGSCGVGECKTHNTPSTCAAGVETACQPGAPVAEVCTGCLDEDCDGLIDLEDDRCIQASNTPHNDSTGVVCTDCHTDPASGDGSSPVDIACATCHLNKDGYNYLPDNAPYVM